MISVNEAKKEVVKNSKHLSKNILSVENALDCVLANDIFSPINLPPFNQSSMDGYAFILEDLLNNIPIHIIGEIAAGKNFSYKLKSGEAIRIFTGAKIPEGSNCVVMQEKTTVEGIKLNINDSKLIKGANIRYKGAQINSGQLALKKGTVLTPASIGFIASMGINTVEVYSKPKISIIITGSELQKPGSTLIEGNVFESNSYSLIAALKNMLIKPIKIETITDNKEETYQAIKKAIEESDLVILTGGISVGDYDFVSETLEELKVETIFYKVKQKPGKPLFFGKKNDTLVFALPGNPAAVLTCFYNYVYPSIKIMQGHSNIFLRTLMLPISKEFLKNKALSYFLKSKINANSVTPLEGQESYILSSFAVADSLIYLPENSELITKDTLVEVFLLP